MRKHLGVSDSSSVQCTSSSSAPCTSTSKGSESQWEPASIPIPSLEQKPTSAPCKLPARSGSEAPESHWQPAHIFIPSLDQRRTSVPCRSPDPCGSEASDLTSLRGCEHEGEEQPSLSEASYRVAHDNERGTDDSEKVDGLDRKAKPRRKSPRALELSESMQEFLLASWISVKASSRYNRHENQIQAWRLALMAGNYHEAYTKRVSPRQFLRSSRSAWEQGLTAYRPAGTRTFNLSKGSSKKLYRHTTK
mmetsp:Transcript_15691/g.29784  ORF Transcript_15691/g.29784 Transcript_15691/m.29784 type:complete len:249 (-) Transcript_15691:132-878(-)